MPRPRKFDETEVLGRVRNCFWERGYDGTSMQDLSEATGLGPQSLYGAFGNKHELFLRALDSYCTEQDCNIQRALENADSPWEGVLATMTFSTPGQRRILNQGCFLTGSATALSGSDADVRTRSVDNYRQLVGRFAAQIHLAQEAGEIAADIDCDDLARTIVALRQGIEFARKVGSSPREMARVKAAAIDTVSRAVTA